MWRVGCFSEFREGGCEGGGVDQDSDKETGDGGEFLVAMGQG